MSRTETSFLSGKRVLIVEDREENRRLLRAILKLEGAQVLEAGDGREGVEIAERELPDVILMDLHMPDVDGIAATKLLRENPLTRALAIIFVTASVSEKSRRDAEEVGSDGFLTKPLDPLRLADQIAEILCRSAR